MDLKVLLMHSGGNTGRCREDIDPLVSISVEKDNIVIYNGFYDYEFPIEDIISLTISKI